MSHLQTQPHLATDASPIKDIDLPLHMRHQQFSLFYCAEISLRLDYFVN